MKTKGMFSLSAGILGGWMMTLLFTACDNDPEPLYAAYGLVLNQQNSSFCTILLDDGNLLYPREAYFNPDKIKDSTRLYVNFNILKERDSSYEVRITYADTILTKSILPYSEAILDSVGNAPIKITKSWFAHGFLNFEFMFAGRTNLNAYFPHMVNLLQYPTENNTLKFEFRHNDFGDYRDKIYIGVVSFPIQGIVEGLEKPVGMEIKFHDSENTTRSIEMTYP